MQAQSRIVGVLDTRPGGRKGSSLLPLLSPISPFPHLNSLTPSLPAKALMMVMLTLCLFLILCSLSRLVFSLAVLYPRACAHADQVPNQIRSACMSVRTDAVALEFEFVLSILPSDDPHLS